MTIATLTIHPLGNVERLGVELDDRVQAWAFAVNGFDPLEVHFHEANGRQIAGLEVASKLLNRGPGQLGVWVGFAVHAASVAQLAGLGRGRRQWNLLLLSSESRDDAGVDVFGPYKADDCGARVHCRAPDGRLYELTQDG